MQPRRVSWIWPAVGMATALVLNTAHWAFGRPGGAEGLRLGPFVMAAGWVFIEWMMSRGEPDRPEAVAIHNMHRLVFTALGFYASLESGLSLAADWTALNAAWKPFAQRAMGVTAGVMLAMWGNHLPKLLSPWRREDEPFDWQRVHRVVGWLAAVGGVVLATSWTALSLGEAETVSRTVVAVVFILALGTKLLSLLTHTSAASSR